jgi:hypothetical protein
MCHRVTRRELSIIVALLSAKTWSSIEVHRPGATQRRYGGGRVENSSFVLTFFVRWRVAPHRASPMSNGHFCDLTAFWKAADVEPQGKLDESFMAA